MDHGESSRIVAVEARTVRVPLSRPTSFSTRQVLARDYALVRVRTADGGEGIGFCYCGTRAGELVTSALRLLSAPLLLGKSALHVEGLWEQMYQESLLHGRVGSVMRATHWRCSRTSPPPHRATSPPSTRTGSGKTASA